MKKLGKIQKGLGAALGKENKKKLNGSGPILEGGGHWGQKTRLQISFCLGTHADPFG